MEKTTRKDETEMERLDKILSGTGRWSRREVKELVRAGRVTANGAVVHSPEKKYDREGLDLRVDGESVSGERFVYLMLHKPAGLVSATEDPRQKTVLELLPPYLRRVGLFPAGRLDRDTEGLLLLTNDGALAHDLLSPRKHVDKTYFVRVAGILDEADEDAFAAGMTLGDGLECLPAGLERLERSERGRCYPAGREIPSDQADACRPGKAGGLSQTAHHGPAHAGPGPGAGGVAAPDRGGRGGPAADSRSAERKLNGVFRHFPQKTFPYLLKREKKAVIIVPYECID